MGWDPGRSDIRFTTGPVERIAERSAGPDARRADLSAPAADPCPANTADPCPAPADGPGRRTRPPWPLPATLAGVTDAAAPRAADPDGPSPDRRVGEAESAHLVAGDPDLAHAVHDHLEDAVNGQD